MAMLSSSSSANGFTHDVFLSFRGTDTRQGFTGNLYKALHDKGFRTFIDDEELHKGEQITPSLLKAIEQSKIAIVVLSENYASSSFCLDELSKIIDCIEEKGQLVWPVFYDVDPSDVRKQTGAYGEAMANHEERFKDHLERLQKWRKSLQKVANLSGWHFKQGDGYEYEFIGKILEEVSRNIKCVTLHVADYPVGLESKESNFKLLLDVGFDDRVHMVGIHGIGGIGKTTLALSVYNSIASNFEGSCFLENVRENSNRYGLLHLQKTLLSKIIGKMNVDLTSVKEGSSIIQHRLRQKKVLLILDDVDKREQLEAIVGRPEWFGPGSRVIITTRDQQLLTSHMVERKYEMGELKNEDALKLLKWKAFKTNEVSPSYVDILSRVVTYAAGLPLALEVIGSYLYKKSIEECKHALDRYEKIPIQEIQNVLKVSYDALDEEEKSVFLDIACCFRGYKLTKLEKILHAHYDDNKKHHIGVLVEKSLIKIIGFGYVTLHDLIEDMGKEIVRQESPEEPGKRSRLWFHKDIVQVLKENTGSSETEIIYLNIPKFGEVAEYEAKTFKKMKNLRTLIVKNCKFSENIKYLQNSLRVLIWDRYSSEGLPFDFHPKKLSTWKFDSSLFTSLKSAALVKKKFENMRVLILDKSTLLQIPDVSGLPNLETLSFKNCLHLVTIHYSVGRLGKLKILCAHGCPCLTSFPPLVLASLEQLDLSSCCSLESFPHVVGSLGTLKILNVEGCSKLKNFSPLKLPSLEILNLSNCESLEKFPPLELASLVQLNLSYCVRLENFPPMVGSFRNLKILNFEGCQMLKNFPPLELASLEKLDLSNCSSLVSFPPVVGSLGKLKVFNFKDCPMLTNFPPLELASLEKLHLLNCDSLVSFPAVVGPLGKLKMLNIEGCRMLKNIPPLELTSLENLDIRNCDSLVSFSPVVGPLGKLKSMYVKDCKKLKNFPPLEMTSLEKLHILSCDSLVSFPPVVGSLDKLKILKVDECSMLKNFPPLKMTSLEELYISLCESLESFPLVVGSLGKLKTLSVQNCKKLKNFPVPLKMASLEQLKISSCGIESFPLVVGSLNKLEMLSVRHCKKLKNLPPLEFPSIKKLDLSYCSSLESFPEILGNMKNIIRFELEKTPIRKFPFSFQNLTGLVQLHLENCGIVEIPSSIVLMPELNRLLIKGGGWLFPKQEGSEEKVTQMQTSKVKYIQLSRCNLLDESLAIGLAWFSNVRELLLFSCEITIIPECIKECHFLWRLELDWCDQLQEIIELPPYLETLSARSCTSLTSSSRRKLMNQEVHEAGNTLFCVPSLEGGRFPIPKWFEHKTQTRDLSFSFWFRNNFPDNMLLCLAALCPPLGMVSYEANFSFEFQEEIYFPIKSSVILEKDHTCIVHMSMEKNSGCDMEVLSENEWYHAKVMIIFTNLDGEQMNLYEEQMSMDIGIHLLKEKSSMEDIQFTNPYANRYLGMKLPPLPHHRTYTSTWKKGKGVGSSNSKTPP